MTSLRGDALARADAVLREHGKTFTWARRFLGQRHAERATRLYALCRHLDDLADEASDRGAAAVSLQAVRAELAAGTSDDPLVASVLDQFGDGGAARRAAVALVDGVTRDLRDVCFTSERELMRYCYRVAGTVGVMMCRVLDQADSAAAPFAVDLGIAMQLTNIARDVHEDALRGRRYVPGDMVDGASPSALAAVADAGLRVRVHAARLALLERADRYYSSGWRGLAFLPLRARFAILIAAANYRAIGDRIRAGGAAVEERAVVPSIAKVWITARSVLAAALRPSFWRRPHAHDAALHEHLAGLDGVNYQEGSLA